MASDLVYRAIAHPARRRILEALLAGECHAMDLPVRLSASALSQHLAVLRRSRLVRTRREGRNIVYALDPQRLHEPFAWLSQYAALWEGQMNKLDRYLRSHHGQSR
jgi:DNA-binding transcriptional ArsR family regulator